MRIPLLQTLVGSVSTDDIVTWQTRLLRRPLNGGSTVAPRASSSKRPCQRVLLSVAHVLIGRILSVDLGIRQVLVRRLLLLLLQGLVISKRLPSLFIRHQGLYYYVLRLLALARKLGGVLILSRILRWLIQSFEVV